MASSELVCLEDYEKQAQLNLEQSAWLYFAAGTSTTDDNVEAYKRYNILPRVLRDVSQVDTSTTLLGQKVTFPIGVSPTAMHANAHHPAAEVATGRASMRSGVCMIQSVFSSKPIEEVSEACGAGQGLRWMQLQPIHDDSMLVDIVQRAERSDYKALVVTCDHPRLALRRYSRSKNPLPFLFLGNFSKEFNDVIMQDFRNNIDKHFIKASATWEWIDWLRSITYLPIVLKGITNAEDAKEALRHDIQAILVSNHGGRNLDGVPATIDLLSEIIDAVDGKVEVYVDGGIRHGTDVFKALALGAKAVFIGRPIIWGLACDGENGAHKVLQILEKELNLAMAFAGCSSVADIIPNFVRHVSYYTGPKRL